jgi:plasmid stabilization system protein ParE
MMTSSGVEFHRLALEDYDDACKSYAKQSIELKHRFKAAVDTAVERISKAPETLPPYQSGEYRWVRVGRFRHILVFRPQTPDKIVIVAVAHTSRRPGYWRRRT